jgi:hypothetical protein
MRKRDMGLVAFSIAPRRHGCDGTSGRIYIEDGASEAVRRVEEEESSITQRAPLNPQAACCVPRSLPCLCGARVLYG